MFRSGEVKVSFAVLVAFFTLGHPALAQEPAPHAVTLDEVLAAVGRAPQHVAAEAHAHTAAEAVDSAGGLTPTTVSLGTSRLQARLIAGVQVPLPVFGRPWAAREVARAERAAARANAGQVDLNLYHDVKLAFYELAHGQARAELAASQAARAARLARVAHQRFEAGDVPRQDTVQADAAAARAAAEASSQKAQVDATSAGLAALLGWDPVEPLRAKGGLKTRFPNAPALGSLTARLGAHPAIAAADAEVAAAQARVAAASRDQWPLLSLDTEAEVFDSSLPGPDVRVLLNMEVPLFGRRSAARDTAAAVRAAAQADRSSVMAAARGALVAAYRRYRAAQQRAQSFSEYVLPAAQHAARLAEIAYEQGEGDLVSVLDAERSLADAKQQWVDARLTAAATLADLTLAAGGVR